MADYSEKSAHLESQSPSQPPWVERFSNKENYSAFSLAVLEACKAFFEQQLSPEHREQLEKMQIALSVTGSLLRGNARPGSDIDLILVMDRNKVAADGSTTPQTLRYEQADVLLQKDELQKFVVDYLQQNQPELYERLFEVRLADFTRRVERYLVARDANPDKYSKDPYYWGNLPPENRADYVRENFLSFYVEVGIFDAGRNVEEEATKIDTDDDLIHGFISLLFSSDLQILFGDRKSLRQTLLDQLTAWQQKDPEKFTQFYMTLQNGFESFLSYNGKNHFYLGTSDIMSQKVIMPDLTQLIQS
jgi:predicted nucleotidyltransferase